MPTVTPFVGTQLDCAARLAHVVWRYVRPCRYWLMGLTKKEGCVAAILCKQKVINCGIDYSLSIVGCAWSLPYSSACLSPCMCHTHSLAWGPCFVPEMVNILQTKLLVHSIDFESLHMLICIPVRTHRANKLLGLLGELWLFVITHNFSRHSESLSLSGLQMRTVFLHMSLRLQI